MDLMSGGTKLANWKRDKAWADKYLPEIKWVIRRIAGEIIDIRIADDNEDQKQATDYVVTVSSGDIGCRVRRWQYWDKYKEVTFRSSRPSGYETEVSKIKSGNSRWYLYAWVLPCGKFGAWVFLDMDVVRESGVLENRREISNFDRSSKFIAIPITELDKQNCILESGRIAKTFLAKAQ